MQRRVVEREEEELRRLQMSLKEARREEMATSRALSTMRGNASSRSMRSLGTFRGGGTERSGGNTPMGSAREKSTGDASRMRYVKVSYTAVIGEILYV